MIPILYDALEKDFTTNGIGFLTDAVSCIVTEERTFTGTLPVVLEIHKTDNNGGIGWTYGNVYIKNGLITSIPQ